MCVCFFFFSHTSSISAFPFHATGRSATHVINKQRAPQWRVCVCVSLGGLQMADAPFSATLCSSAAEGAQTKKSVHLRPGAVCFITNSTCIIIIIIAFICIIIIVVVVLLSNSEILFFFFLLGSPHRNHFWFPRGICPDVNARVHGAARASIPRWAHVAVAGNLHKGQKAAREAAAASAACLK